jgi:hypothetical protein
MPFEGDDLLWMQDGIRGGIANILTAMYGNNDIIVTGVSINQNGTDLDYTEGYVVINGELLHLPAGTASGVAQEPERAYIVPDISYDMDGADVFADGQTKDTYEIRKAKLGDPLASPPAGAIDFSNIDERRYHEVYEVPDSLMQGAWVRTLEIVKIGKMVSMRGYIQGGQINTDFIAGIPTRFRPPDRSHFVVTTNSGDNADEVLFRVVLYTDGRGKVMNLSGASGLQARSIYLTGINYMLL